MQIIRKSIIVRRLLHAPFAISSDEMKKKLDVYKRQEEIPKIFTRFYRSFTVMDQEGVGIGLYLAREIIRVQKGYIKVISKPGEGSVFSVFLPR